MKIAMISLMVNGRDEGLSWALRREATQYAEFPVNTGAKRFLDNLSFVPDVLFLQIHHNQIDGFDTVKLLEGAVKRLQAEGTRVINWNGDIRHRFPQWMAIFPADVNAFSNMRDVRQIPKNGKFLQIGIDPQVFKRWSKPTNEDVVFMGNNYGHQFPLGRYRIEAAAILRNKFGAKLYGNYEGSIENLNANPKDPFPNQSRESQIYSNCGIAISISHFNVERYTSDRLFRCMGSGAFTLAHHYTGIEQDFKIGKHLDTFKDHKEMEDKINYYLANPKERKQIADAGYKHVQENFTYANMSKNILEL